MSNTNKTREITSTGSSQTQETSVIKNALKMAFGTMTSRVLGLLREVLLAALFEKHITDSWSAAFRVPNMFRRLLGEGSLSVSFIPIFIEARMDSEVRAKNLVNAFYSILLIFLAAITTLGVLYPDLILQVVLDPAYIAQAEKYQLTVHMARIMFLFLFFISSFAFAMGILNALGEFFLPALAPTFWNIAMVISTVWPKHWLPESYQTYGDQLAWGVVIGGFFQCLVLVPALVKKNYLPQLTLKFKNADVFKVFKNMGPGLVGVGLLQFTTIINLRFSSSLQEGTISYINYIDRLIELPLSLISVSLGTALLPSLSSLWSKGKAYEMSEQSRKYLELNILISIAAACGLYSLAQPIVQFLFGRGHFNAQDVLAASDILKTYCWILVFASGVRVLTPAYYAVQNTWFPALISGVCLIVHVVMAPYLMSKYLVHGLMISTILTAFLNMTFLMLFYNRFIYKFQFGLYFKNVAKFILLGGVVYSSSRIYFVLNEFMPTRVGMFFSLLSAVILSGVLFVLVGRWIRVEALNETINRIQKRFPRFF